MATRARKSTGSRSQVRGKAGVRGRGRASTARRRGGNASGAAATRSKPAGARGGNRARVAARARGRGRGRSGASAARQQDALAMLKTEHDEVSKLFDDFERAAHSRGANGASRKAQLAVEICRQLQAHAQIEEEIFYPAAAAAIKDQELIPEATVEHQSAKDLIAKIERMDPEEELFDATVMVLGEYVRHHVKEEQNELFPLARRSSLDLVGLGQQMRDRKAQVTM